MTNPHCYRVEFHELSVLDKSYPTREEALAAVREEYPDAVTDEGDESWDPEITFVWATPVDKEDDEEHAENAVACIYEEIRR